jgi:hypothetical protein
VPPEGVVNALRTIHRALVPGGLLVDTQPVSALPPIETAAGELGRLDMREWAQVIEAVDRRVEEAIRDGLFALEEQRRYVIGDDYDDGADLAAEVREWVGTRVDQELAGRLAAETRPVRLHQEVRLRVLRAVP